MGVCVTHFPDFSADIRNGKIKRSCALSQCIPDGDAISHGKYRANTDLDLPHKQHQQSGAAGVTVKQCTLSKLQTYKAFVSGCIGINTHSLTTPGGNNDSRTLQTNTKLQDGV